MLALEDLVHAGLRPLHGRFELGGLAAGQVARRLDKHAGGNRLESLQAYDTIAGRDLEREILPLLVEEKVGLMVVEPARPAACSAASISRDGSGRGRSSGG